MTTETRPLSTESAPIQPYQTEDGAGSSPLSLQESHARLSLHATKLGESVKAAKVRSDEAVALYRKLRDELDELERGLRALSRVTQHHTRTPK
jgi:hypothetical protein